MNTGAIVALFVSVLGTFIIVSLVFLVYKWRANTIPSNISVVDEEFASPQMQQYRIRRGRMVPKENTQSILSTRSGWQTLRHATIIFNSPNTATKVDQSSIRTVEVKRDGRTHRPKSSVPSVPPTPDWRKKLMEIQTQPQSSLGGPVRPQLSLAVPSTRQESWRSIRSPRERWKQLHETIHELETPPSEPSNPFDTPRSSKKSSRESGRASSHPTTFLESPTRDSYHPTIPQSPPPAYVAPSTTSLHPALR